MAKELTTLPKKTLEEELEKLIRHVNSNMDKAQQWLAQKQNDILEWANDEFEKRIEWINDSGNWLDQKVLTEAKQAYLNVWLNYEAKPAERTKATKDFINTIKRFVIGEEHKAPMLDWQNTLQNKLERLSKQQSDVLQDVDKNYEKMLGNYTSELQICLGPSNSRKPTLPYNIFKNAMVKAYVEKIDAAERAKMFDGVEKEVLDRFDKEFEVKTS